MKHDHPFDAEEIPEIEARHWSDLARREISERNRCAAGTLDWQMHDRIARKFTFMARGIPPVEWEERLSR